MSDRRRGTRRIVIAAGGAVGVLILAAVLGLRIVVSPSMPRGVYLAQSTTGILNRGDTVAVCLPHGVLSYARQRGYVEAGLACPGHAQSLTKAVLAIEGDTVRVTDRGVHVGDRLLRNSAARATDSRGRPLHRVTGTLVVPPNHVWLGSTFDPSSFDSRYFGPLPNSAVISRRRPIWTERPGAR